MRDWKVLVFGVGPVGGTVGGWVAPHHASMAFYDRPEVVSTLRERGLTLYPQGQRDRAEQVGVWAIDDLAEMKAPDIVILAVKNYSLDGVAKMLRETLDGNPIVVALQNGVENQRILPRYFDRVVYGIVSYNAWLDEPGVIGYQKRGPLAVGTILNLMQPELGMVSELLNLGVETVITERLQDAAISKMIINLTNSLTTLVGHGFHEISEPILFQKLLSNMTYEGSQIAQAAGVREYKLGGMPSWKLMAAAARLPAFITKRKFDENVKKMVVSSMAQDVLQRKSADSELETLNGFFIQLADEHGVAAPFNRTVYELCREHFTKPDFRPLDVREVWSEVQRRSRGGLAGLLNKALPK